MGAAHRRRRKGAARHLGRRGPHGLDEAAPRHDRAVPVRTSVRGGSALPPRGARRSVHRRRASAGGGAAACGTAPRQSDGAARSDARRRHLPLAQRRGARSQVRRSHARQEPVVHRRRGADARARHRRQHGHLHAVRRDPAPRPAGSRSVPPRPVHRRHRRGHVDRFFSADGAMGRVLDAGVSLSSRSAAERLRLAHRSQERRVDGVDARVRLPRRHRSVAGPGAPGLRQLLRVAGGGSGARKNARLAG